MYISKVAVESLIKQALADLVQPAEIYPDEDRKYSELERGRALHVLKDVSGKFAALLYLRLIDTGRFRQLSESTQAMYWPEKQEAAA